MVLIETANLEDAQSILDLQKLAYTSEAAIYDDYSIPPLNQTLEEIQEQFVTQTFLKATINSWIVGSVRAIKTRAECQIGRLIVHPDHQNRGIGTSLMGRIEEVDLKKGRIEVKHGLQGGGKGGKGRSVFLLKVPSLTRYCAIPILAPLLGINHSD